MLRWTVCIFLNVFFTVLPVPGSLFAGSLLTGLLFTAPMGNAAIAQDVDFNRDVRPILSNKCFACHGPDENQLEAGLRLDDGQIATRPLESGSIAIVPGDAGMSELISRVTHADDDLRMPPASFGKRLTVAEIDVLKTWIEQGASFARHWSYVKPVRPQIPQASPPHADWIHNEIDAFVLQQIVSQGLQPSAEADRPALARRVFLDLIGLPPAPEEVAAFVADSSQDAYERLVDGLLQRPEFGEHWARKWLDLSRYADSAGYADDPARTIWAYRDWVIRAINQNMPFDQFTIEQLAGDLLPNVTEDQLVATAFHRNTLTNNEGGTNDEEFRNVAVVDRVNTTLAVWMGTTMACAQCHTHKYDPISQQEYFQVFAILNNTQDADRRDESPVVELFTAEQLQQKSRLEQQIAELQQVLEQPSAELAASQQKWEASLLAPAAWTTVIPAAVIRSGGQAVRTERDGRIISEAAADTEILTLDIAAAIPATIPAAEEGERAAVNTAATEETVKDTARSDTARSDTAATVSDVADATLIAGIRLQTVPDAMLPGGGAGHGGGNFVVSQIRAQLVPAGDPVPAAQYVRISIPGTQKILSLAEVQIFSGGTNVAGRGKATQSSTSFDGPPEYAIDGNTDGVYVNKSVTHTAVSDDPWWEVDLGKLQPIERVTLWNRADNGLATRLSNFQLSLLDADRNPVWTQQIAEPPQLSADYKPSGIRDIVFEAAIADYSQTGFAADSVISGKPDDSTGWAVGGAVQEQHTLVLVPAQPVTLGAGEVLRVRIEQQSKHVRHVLGSFRIAVTGDDAAIRRSQVPQLLLSIVETEATQRTEQQATDLARYYRANVATELAEERKQLASARTQLSEMKPATSVPVLRELTSGRRTTHLQYRGNYLDLGPEVQEGMPSAFHPLNPDDLPNAGAKPNRLSLARWLVDRDNPLTARVLVNRYWETLFGRGIVVTSEEFGSQGEPPSHPELLDWLAVEVMDRGWDTKAILKTIVLSATYRQRSDVTPDLLAADADNRWLARGPRVRLSAESIRDQALFVSGLLSPKRYGPPVKPPQPSLGLNAAFGSSTDWQTSPGEDRYRRGLYTTWRRSNPYPSMATFDAPNREVCTVRRNTTNTPLQSLVTLNDPVYVEAAQALARRVLQTSQNPGEQIAAAFQRCLLRVPTDQELHTLQELYHDARQRLEGTPEEAVRLATDPSGDLPPDVAAVDAAAMTVVSNVILNLDEMFLKR